MVEETGRPPFTFDGRPDLGRGFFHVCDQQTTWAKQRNIGVDRRCRVARPELNLYGPFRPETRAALEAGDGKELKDKFPALYSSSALAVNAFDYWHDRDRVLGSSFGLTGPLRLRFENKHQIFDHPKARKSNVDVELNGTDANLVLECKFTEPFVRYPRRSAPFSSTYFKLENDSIWRGMESTRSFAEQINQGEEGFTRLNPEQLIKTALGCRRTFGSSWRFLYVWYEPVGRDIAEECQVLREELARFREKTLGEIPFAAMTWAELLAKLEVRAHPADVPYVAWLRDRYFSPAESA